jgi:hypothetical protein
MTESRQPHWDWHPRLTREEDMVERHEIPMAGGFSLPVVPMTKCMPIS